MASGQGRPGGSLGCCSSILARFGACYRGLQGQYSGGGSLSAPFPPTVARRTAGIYPALNGLPRPSAYAPLCKTWPWYLSCRLPVEPCRAADAAHCGGFIGGNKQRGIGLVNHHCSPFHWRAGGLAEHSGGHLVAEVLPARLCLC